MGSIISDIWTKQGEIHSSNVLTSDEYSGIIISGHNNGCVCCWSPNQSTPVAKILAHKECITNCKSLRDNNSW